MGENWIAIAKECGFDQAGDVDIATLKPMQMVRDSCAEDKCRRYNRNWTCPPNCGTLEECDERMQSYRKGVLLQTVTQLEKVFDAKGYRRAGENHARNLKAFAEIIREVYPDALILGAGGCFVCKKCNFPEPCLFPEKAMSSMEGYGLFVTQVCRDNGMQYNYGPETITYSACVLYEKR